MDYTRQKLHYLHAGIGIAGREYQTNKLHNYHLKSKKLMSDIQEIIEALVKFRDERDWAQFHNSKDLALAINVEAGELLELFLWKDASQANPDSSTIAGYINMTLLYI